MKELALNFKEIAKGNRQLLIAMALLLISSVVFVVMSIASISPSNLQVAFRYTSYGEHYYYSSWYYIFCFPFMSLVLGVLHNLLIVKIYSKKGSAIASWFAYASLLTMIVLLIVLSKILGLHGSI